MKSILFSLLAAMAAIGCAKNPGRPPVDTHPEMQYINLEDRVISFNQFVSFDLDGNGEKDVKFSTLLVGDPLNQLDKRQWLVSTYFYSFLPVDNAERIPVLNTKDTIRLDNFGSYHWYNASAIILAEKIISVQEPPYWRGDWKESAHQYIPIMVQRNNLYYAGWVEISFDKDMEKLILHRAAISKEAGRSVVTGV